jgi:hypothetical protein
MPASALPQQWSNTCPAGTDILIESFIIDVSYAMKGSVDHDHVSGPVSMHVLTMLRVARPGIRDRSNPIPANRPAEQR